MYVKYNISILILSRNGENGLLVFKKKLSNQSKINYDEFDIDKLCRFFNSRKHQKIIIINNYRTFKPLKLELIKLDSAVRKPRLV